MKKFFAVGWASIDNEMYPEPTSAKKTFAIFSNSGNAIEFATKFGGCKIREVEVSLKYARLTKRAVDLKPQSRVKAKSRKASSH